MKTSRDTLLDKVEIIANCIAISSHCIELSNFYQELWKDEDKQFILEIAIEYSNLRRDIMKQILDDYDWDKNYWCLLKHCVSVYWYASEIYLSEKNKTNEDMLLSAYSSMISIVCKFCWLKETVTCWRCLTDMVATLHSNINNE